MGISSRGLLRRWLMCLWVLAAMTGTPGGAAELNPVRTHPHGTPAAAAQQLIVKLRADTAAAATALAQPSGARERIVALTSRSGVRLVAHRPITALIHAVQVEPAMGESAAATLARLRADTEVEYAVRDERRYIHAAPNDPLYPQQWYLQSAAATPSAVDAFDAWATTTGSATLVIADIDTGVRPDHPDLTGRLLPGYCFISDAFVANGGACPGPGASDPGDWITSSDITNNPGECGQATAMPSSW
ncbi:MAG TPA: hypothetical protein VEC59_08135, partial [Steroidobacteraceae bacterium]|nr:hypothetical protein [Steroidobacteraceae bacterium]